MENELLADGTIRHIVVAHTDIQLNNNLSDYSETTWRELINHIQTWQSEYRHEVRLRRFANA
jgi:hypothetical protein